MLMEGQQCEAAQGTAQKRTLASKLLSGRVRARRRSTVVATLRRGHTARLLAASRSSI